MMMSQHKMVKIVAIAALFAAFVALANGQAGAEPQLNMPTYGGYNCPGKITEIRCDEDDNGVLQGIAFFNAALGGWTCFGAGCSNATATDPPGESFVIPDGRSIVKVTACRGRWYGYTSATFFLDDGTKFTCGRGKGDYKPSGYSSWAGKYATYGYTTMAPPGRKLQQDVDTQFFWRFGWGWRSKCQTYQSQKRPYWATVPKGKYPTFSGSATPKWAVPGTAWNNALLNSQSYINNMYWGPSYVAPGAPSDNWTAYTWMPPTPRTAKPIQYFRQWDEYRKKFTECRPAARCGYTPAYYYSQVYPLASFKALVDANGYIYNLHSWCFNNKYMA
jgi:hypothetical protein